MKMLDIEKFKQTPLQKEPFPYMILPGFLTKEACDTLRDEYPQVPGPGSYPTPSLTVPKKFQALLDELQGEEMTKLFAEKFDMDLTGHPTMVTIRGKCRARDGQIHIDSRSKLITVLIYMNGEWEEDGGRLRLLKSEKDLSDDNTIAETPPDEGTLVAFLNTTNAWHGHAPFEGNRRAIQLNWVQNNRVVKWEQTRHRISAFLKKLKGK